MSQEETDSAATSEEYEIVSSSKTSPQLEEESRTDLIMDCLEGGTDRDDKCNTFHNVTYLGSGPISHPTDDAKIQNYISDFNSKEDGSEVSLSVPKTSDGDVIVDARTRYSVDKIIFFLKGNLEGVEANCFAFTYAKDSKIFECHVFRCSGQEVVSQIFLSFAAAFKRTENSAANTGEGVKNFNFELFLDVQEAVDGVNFEVVPRHKGHFKLRTNVVKKVIITVRQSPQQHSLKIERCFGMLVSPGRNVRHVDMQLLEKISMAHNEDDVVITGVWDPRESAYAGLNKETGSDITAVYMTIAVDLVVTQIAEPLRFVIETRIRIYPQTERYWYYSRKIVTRQYIVRLKRRQQDELYDLLGMDFSEELDLKHPSSSLTLQLANSVVASFVMRTSSNEPAIEDEEDNNNDDIDDDDDEPPLSGSGQVSKDCSHTELDSWSCVLKDWAEGHQPKQLAILVKRGIPEALRGEVWQRLTRASDQTESIIETYKILITKESPDEKIILRDIQRTFPAHEFFKKVGGVGQESLYRISKAYSIYDSEIAYCQGQSFLIAALLLQMPEEQAFGVLVKIMHDLGLRDIFRENFEQLQLRLYQLDRLIEATMPDLWTHFTKTGLESHMYASQWFLTLFTAKFPLFLVFRVIDVFLYFGFDSIFQVALGMLKVSKKDMLSLDFEGLMKYFRVNIPKRYRSEEHARCLMEEAMNIKLKRLKKYEKEWVTMKEAERAREDPLIRYERENKKLLNDKLRLDTENDNLARQLVNSKIEMRKEIDLLEDAKDYLEKEVTKLRVELKEVGDEKKRLDQETENLKSLLKRELDKLESEIAKKANVIDEYKVICSQLSAKLDNKQHFPREEVEVSEKGASATEDRIRELELELAQTKLALVETECKNQDLLHQYNSSIQENVKSSTWFSKTLSSIKESAVAAGAATKTNTTIKKSTSVDIIN